MVDREAEFTKVREDIRKANSVLCIGAGPTGVETSSYLKEAYPKK